MLSCGEENATSEAVSGSSIVFVRMTVFYLTACLTGGSACAIVVGLIWIKILMAGLIRPMNDRKSGYKLKYG